METKLQKYYGMYFFNIISGSMEPKLYKDDIIIVKNCDTNLLEENDIITFNQDNKIISHRITKITEENGERNFQTKGDNNDVIDDFVVKPEQIYGKVAFKIPKIGKITKFIQNDNGLIKVFILILIIFILFNMNDNKKNRRKIIRKKYEIKKTREGYNREG